MFEEITIQKRNDLEQELYEAIKSQFQKEELEDGYYLYEVKLQDAVFITSMRDDQLRTASQYAIDILEEFKRINNSGMNRVKFNSLVEEVKKSSQNDSDISYIMEPIEVMDSIATERLRELKLNIARLCKVGGAYWVLISNPCFVSALFAVFESIIGNFNNEDHYRISAYFLLRAIMNIRSKQLNDEEAESIQI